MPSKTEKQKPKTKATTEVEEPDRAAVTLEPATEDPERLDASVKHPEEAAPVHPKSYGSSDSVTPPAEEAESVPHAANGYVDSLKKSNLNPFNKGK